MAISEVYTGTATVSTTEVSLVSGTTTLQSVATPAVIQVFIDTSNMGGLDQYEIDIKDKVTSGGIQRVIYTSTLTGRQSTPFVSPSLIVYHGWDVTITKIAQVDKSFTWSIRKVG
jgi:hypothetical protein